jgi:two-component system sensor kinase FixL
VTEIPSGWGLLVIEDDPDTGANLRDILELDDYRVELAGSLAEALEGGRRDDLLAVLVDRRLPDGTVDDRLAEIRKLAPEAAIVIVTGYADLAGAIAALRQGADDYLLKPIDPDTLRVALARSVEHRRTRDALRESGLRSEAILNTALDGIITIDEKGGIESANPAALQLFGYTADELIGRNIQILMPPPMHDEHDDYIARYLETGQKRFLGTVREVPGLRKDGTIFQQEIAVMEIKLGRRRLFTATIRDLTERKRVEEALRRSERRVREAQELASIGTLAAGLAHEVGTPMNVILGYAQMIQSAVEDETLRQRAGIIREQIQRISKIIQTLLNFARPGKRRRSVVTLPEVVEESVSLLKERFRKRGVTVECDFEAVPELWADGEKLQQVLLNLCMNAVDAMPEGGTLRIRLAPHGDSEVEIRVSDTGTGISPDELEHLFEPFYSTKDRREGTGLGLTVAKGIVFDHGGRIDVTSQIGKGSEFQIVLPVGTS